MNIVNNTRVCTCWRSLVSGGFSGAGWLLIWFSHKYSFIWFISMSCCRLPYDCFFYIL